MAGNSEELQCSRPQDLYQCSCCAFLRLTGPNSRSNRPAEFRHSLGRFGLMSQERMVFERLVRLTLVVLFLPSLQLFTGIRQIIEHLHIQTFFSKATIQRFDASLVSRFAWPNNLMTALTSHSPNCKRYRQLECPARAASP